MKTGVWVAAVLFLGMVSAIPASATAVTYELMTGQSVGSQTAPYATVTITYVSSTQATVSVNILDNDYLYGPSTSTSVFGFNSANGVTISSIASYNSGTLTSDVFAGSTSPSKAIGGFGNFQYIIYNTSGTGELGNQLSFTITATGGYTFANTSASLGQFFDNNTTGYGLATEITQTGSSAEYAASPVPEPASIALLGSGLCALGGWIRKRKNKL